jgi:hypothetical protein
MAVLLQLINSVSLLNMYCVDNAAATSVEASVRQQPCHVVPAAVGHDWLRWLHVAVVAPKHLCRNFNEQIWLLCVTLYGRIWMI